MKLAVLLAVLYRRWAGKNLMYHWPLNVCKAKPPVCNSFQVLSYTCSKADDVRIFLPNDDISVDIIIYYWPLNVCKTKPPCNSFQVLSYTCSRADGIQVFLAHRRYSLAIKVVSVDIDISRWIDMADDESSDREVFPRIDCGFQLATMA